MTDIKTPTKGLAQQTVGGNNDEWGDILNNTIRLIDSALGGTLDRILTGDVTLTSTEIQNSGYHFRGTLIDPATVIFPTYFGLAVIRNSADKPIGCGMAGGRFVTISPHGCAAIWSDGTDFTDVNQFLTLGGGLTGIDAKIGSGAEGGSLNNVAGAGDSAGAGGSASLIGGAGGSSGPGGALNLSGGAGGMVGGDASLRAGDAQEIGDGGNVWITSGKGKGPGHRSGNIVLAAYNSESGAVPGDLRLELGLGKLVITGLPTNDPIRTDAFWLNNGVIVRSGSTLSNAMSQTGALMLSGGTMTGPLTLDGSTPTLGAQAASKAYVDGKTQTAGSGVYLSLSGGTMTGTLTLHQGTVAPANQVPVNLLSQIDNVAGVAAGAFVPFNSMIVSADSSTTATNCLLSLGYTFGGAGFTGQAIGFSSNLFMNAASNPANTSTYYISANVTARANASAGGTNTTEAGSKGQLYGLNVTPTLLSGATNFMELTSAEVDSTVQAGASLARRVNLKLILLGNHAVQGTVSDAILQFGRSRSATAGARVGLMLGSTTGVFPMDNTLGAFIAHEYGIIAMPGMNPQLNTFIDASHIHALSAMWTSPGATLDGSGNRTIGPGTLGWSPTGASLDVFGQVGGTPAIVAGGTGAVNGQEVTTGNGDIYTVTASAGVITALTPVVRATSRTTGPTGAQTIQGDGIVGATCTIPWTNARALSIQPSGGTLGFNGATPIAKPSVTGSRGGLLNTPVTSVGVPANITENILQTFDTPANILRNVGDRVRIVSGGTVAASTDNKTVRVKLNGNAYGQLSMSTVGVVVWRCEIEVTKTGAGTQSLVSFVIGHTQNATVQSSGAGLTDTAAITVSVTGQNNSNPVLNSITCNYLSVESLPMTTPMVSTLAAISNYGLVTDSTTA